MDETARATTTTKSAPAAQTERIVSPAVDIIERHDSFEVIADMPGADASSIDVVAGRDTLRIQGRWVITQPDGYTQSLTEFVPCTYRCELGLNERIDQERIHARFIDGVLSVTLPKAHGAITRRVEVIGA